MKKLEICLLCLCLCLFSLCGCRRYERIEATSPAPVVVSRNSDEAESRETAETEDETTAEQETTILELTTQEETEPPLPERIPVKVKGVYLTAYVAGTTSMFDEILSHIDETEINTVVIDVKNDEGRVTFAMDSPIVNEVGSVQKLMDIESVMAKLKERGIYTIARIVAFRDPYLPEQRPEWGLHLADGSLYRDNKGLAWVNPYKREVWDYLVEVALEAHRAGFDEVQFDYIRFSRACPRRRSSRSSWSMSMRNASGKACSWRRMCSAPSSAEASIRTAWASPMEIWRPAWIISVR